MLSNQPLVSKWFASVDLSNLQSYPSNQMSVEPFLSRLYEQSGNRTVDDEDNALNSNNTIEDVVSVSFSGKIIWVKLLVVVANSSPWKSLFTSPFVQNI